MRITLLWVGKTRDGNLKAAIGRYLERIGRYVPVDLVEVKEEAAADRHAEAGALVKEGRRLREKAPRDHEVILLDSRGGQMSSEQFADFLERRMNFVSGSKRGLTFIIGGHQGVDDKTRRFADRTLSLSKMTLTHEMARLVLVEQIYRGLSILRGARYHR